MMPCRRQTASRFHSRDNWVATRACGGTICRRTDDRSQRQKHPPLPWLLALGFALLFIVAVPWYWSDGGGEQPLVLGMPLWVAVSTGVSFLISCLAAWAAFRTWPSDDDDAEGGS